MPIDSELEYLRRQTAKKNFNAAMGYQPINQGDSSEADLTPWVSFTQNEQGTAPMNYQMPAQQQQAEKDDSFWSNFFGKTDEIQNQVTTGIVRAGEGILDFFANAIGAFGDWTGWYDSTPFTEWSQIDLGEKYYNWNKAYNVSPWSLIKKAVDGELNAEFFQKRYEGLGNLLSLGNIDREENYADEAEQNYEFNTEWKTPVGQFVGEAAQTIGFMVPSIVVGMATGGASTAAQAASLGTMFLSAAGKQGEKALNEGTNVQNAFWSGVASGGIEVATEIVTGKILGKAAKAFHLDKLADGFGRINGVTYANQIGKVSATQLISSMIEEGAEEVLSDLASPFVEWIAKGGNLTDISTYNALFQEFGNSYSDPEFWRQTGHSFISGAAIGGMMGASATVSAYSRYTRQGVALANNSMRLGELESEFHKAALNNEDTTELGNRISDLKNTIVEQATKMKTSSDLKVQRGLMNYEYDAMKSAQNTINQLNKRKVTEAEIVKAYDNAYSDFIQEITTPVHEKLTNMIRDGINAKLGLSNIDKWVKIKWANNAQIASVFNNILNDELAKMPQFQNQDRIAYLQQIIADAGNGTSIHGFYDNGSKTVYLNEVDKDNVGKLIRHEVFSHALLDSDQAIRKELIDYIESDQTLKAEYDGLTATLMENGYDMTDIEEATSERLAHFLESHLENSKVINAIFDSSKGLHRLATRIYNFLSRFSPVDNKIVNSLQKVLSNAANIKTATNGRLAMSQTKNRVDSDGYVLGNNGKRLVVERDYDSDLDDSNYYFYKIVADEGTVADKRLDRREYQYYYVRANDPFFDDMPDYDSEMVEQVFDEGYDAIINEETGQVIPKNDNKNTEPFVEEKNNARAERKNSLGNLRERREIGKLSEEDFKKYVTSDYGIQTSADEDAYIEEIERRKLYKQHKEYAYDSQSKVLLETQHIIPKEYYTKRMAAVAELAERLGTEVIFYSKTPSFISEGDASAVGLFDESTNKCFVDCSWANLLNGNKQSFGRGEVWFADQIARHELGHYIWNMKGANWQATRIFEIKEALNSDNSFGEQLSKIFNRYKKRWNSFYQMSEETLNNQVYEELAVQLWSESLVLDGQEARAWQNGFIETINRSAGITNKEFNRFRFKKTKNGMVASVAPYRYSNINAETLEETRKEVEPQFYKKAEDIAKAIGIDMTHLSAVGGFLSTTGPYAGLHVNEVSGKFTLATSNFEDVKLFAFLLSDLGYEVQEAGIAKQYLGKDFENENSNGRELTIGLKEKGFNQKVVDILASYELGYTYDDANGKISLDVIYDYDSLEDRLDKIDKVLEDLEKEGLADGKQKAEQTAINSVYGDAKTRRDFYEAWLESADTSRKGRVLGEYVNEALAKAKEEIANSTTEVKIRGEGELAEDKDVTIEDTDKTPQIPNEYVKAVGELNNDKVYAFKQAQETVRDISKDIFKALGFDPKQARIEYSGMKMYESTKALFDLFNKKGVTANEIVDGLMDIFSDIQVIPTGKAKGRALLLGDYINFADKTDIRKIASDHITDFTMSGKDSFKTKVNKREQAFAKLFKEMRNSLLAYARDMKARIDPTHTLRTTIKRSSRDLDREVTLTGKDDNAKALTLRTQIGSYIAAPFLNIQYKRNGNFGTLLKNYQELLPSLDEVLENYSEEAYEKMSEPPLFPFDQDLRDRIEDFRDSLKSLPQPKVRKDGVTIYPNLTTGQIKLANSILESIASMNKRAVKNFSETLQPRIIGAKKGIGQALKNKFIRFIGLNPYAFNTASFSAIIKARLGGSVFGRELTIGMDLADGERKAYVASASKLIGEQIDKMGLEKEMGKMVTFHGTEIQVGHLIDLYCGLNSINFDGFDKNGVTIKDKKGVVHTIIEKGQANQAIEDVNKALSENAKKFGDWLLTEVYNKKYLNDYIKYREDAGYKDAKVSGNYYPRSADLSDQPSDVTKMVRAPKVFQNDKARVKHNHPFELHDATRRAMQYAYDLGTAMKVYPKYRENFFTLRGIWSDLGSNKADLKFRQSLLTTLGMWVGLDANGNKVKTGGLTSFLLGNYSRKLLSFNVGTPFRQTVSLLYSNLSFTKAIRGVANRLFGSSEFKAEFRQLATEFSQMAYRASGSENLKLNLATGSGKIAYYLRKVADIGMKPIEIFDNATIQAGLASCMVFAKDMGYKSNLVAYEAYLEAEAKSLDKSLSAEEIKAAKQTMADNKNGYEQELEYRNSVQELFADFVETQIGQNPNNLSRLARGDTNLGNIGQFLTFLQGPMRAAEGAFIDKANTASLAKGWTSEGIETAIEETKKAKAEAEKAYNEALEAQANVREQYNETFHSDELDGDEKREALDVIRKDLEEKKKTVEETAEAFANATADYDQAEQNKKIFEKYKLAGGNKWVVSSISAMAVGALLNALINALSKRVRGKEDWDKWKGEELLSDALLYGTVGWLPLASTVTNALNGYDTTYPAGAMLSEFTSFISTWNTAIQKGFDEKSGKAALRESLSALSTLTGLPIKNVYSTFYGTVKTASPAIAEEMNGLFYNNYITNKSVIEALSDNKTDLAKNRLNKLVNSRVGDIGENLQSEMLKLIASGEDPIPSALPTSLMNEDRESVTISWTNQQEAKKHYSKANSQVSELINSSAYKNLSTEERASAIKAIYIAYRSAALAKALGKEYTASLNRQALLAKSTAGKVGAMISAVAHIRSLEATKTKTKKELAVAYVNRLAGLTKAERLVILKMAGYAVDSSTVSRYLRSKGLSKQEAEAFAS